MKITFHGAARCVTGSKHLIELENGLKILLDCGLFQGNPKEADKLNRHFGFNPADINFILLSHAHIDHCGLIPRMVKEGFRGTIYCTDATYDLAKILMLDSAQIHESDIQYINKHRHREGRALLEPLYNTDDVFHSLYFFHKVTINNTFQLDKHVSCTFTDVGHIIGSAAIHLDIEENGEQKRILFSGDVGRYNDEILKAPTAFPESDYVILESTYGNSLHDDVAITDQMLLDVITDTCIRKKGRVIIPSFSVGRTQELVYALNRLHHQNKLPDIPFFVDSPLSVEATRVVKEHPECYNEKILQFMQYDPEPFEFERLQYVKNVEDSMLINEIKEPCVIISASGMADAGRVKHHIKHAITYSKNTILLVGYCEPSTLGGKLIAGQKEVTIYGEPYLVNARVVAMKTLSAHGDRDDLIRFIKCHPLEKIKKLFLVHGEFDVQQDFKNTLHSIGIEKIEIPEPHQSFKL